MMYRKILSLLLFATLFFACDKDPQETEIPVSSVTLSKTELTLVEGEEETLVATVKPDNATDKSVVWSSTNASIATVENGKVSAIKEGTATITAKAGQEQASCVVTVSPKVVHVEGVMLNETSIEIDPGSSFELIATVYPKSATNKDIIWTSSNDNVATVDAGMVKGISPGEATIKATTVDGAFDAICNVRINAPEFKGLTFTSTGETGICLLKIGSPDDVSLEYSLNGGAWVSYTVGNGLALTDGDKVSFRAGANGNTSFAKDPRNYHCFIVSGSGTVASSGSIMSLLNQEESLVIPSPNCFLYLFYGCTSLTTAPELPATTLAENCYYGMFHSCSSLTTAPTVLPATTLASYCYQLMFYKCTSLTSAPELPATTMAEGCYRSMFYHCSSLTTAPELPATTLAEKCYSDMFHGCTSLTTAPGLPVTALTPGCYSGMFVDCTSLTTAPGLPATTLTPGCYYGMFAGCTNLTSAPELPATTLAEKCYSDMFHGCSSLTTAHELPATTLAENCYETMFMGCTSLTTAPELPATTLAENCYYGMFWNCTSITTAPELPATTLANYCYQLMFYSCSSLTTAPTVLPATTLAESCYSNMFHGCTSLTTAPTVLPATTLAKSCYREMFSLCTSLTPAPELPATTLADSCYLKMFYFCTSLTTAPELPAITLAEGCYREMFKGCRSLNYIKALFTTTPDETYTYHWVNSVAYNGTFVKNKDATWDVTGANGVPKHWTISFQ